MMGLMNGVGPGPMMPLEQNPYVQEVLAAQQRIGRLKDRLAARAAARRSLAAGRDGDGAQPMLAEAQQVTSLSAFYILPCLEVRHMHALPCSSNCMLGVARKENPNTPALPNKLG